MKKALGVILLPFRAIGGICYGLYLDAIGEAPHGEYHEH